MTAEGAFSFAPRVAVASLSSALEVGADRAPAVAGRLERLLDATGCEVVGLGSIGHADQAVAAGRIAVEKHVDAAVFAPACWFEDYLVLDFIEECPAPVLFWPLPGMETGALCGVQQITCYLKQLGHTYQTVFGPHEENACLEKALVFLRAVALKGRLRRARVGLAGQRVDGMTHTSANEFMLKKVLGPRVTPIDLGQLLTRAAASSEADARAEWLRVAGKCGSCDVEQADGVDAMRVCAALREVVAERALDAVSFGCYPDLMGRACLAASLLADEGIPVACEGDVNGAVGQLMLSLLTGKPTHNTDWLDPLEDGSVLFTHCGSGSFSLAEHPEEIRLSPVRLMGQGVCALFTAKPGPVTLLSVLGRPNGYQCALLEGEALSTEMVFPGNPVRVRFDRQASELIEWISFEGIGHHWMICYGHVGPEIREWARIVGESLRFLEP